MVLKKRTSIPQFEQRRARNRSSTNRHIRYAGMEWPMQIEMTRVILYVRDVPRLKVFYETHFGFRTIEEIEGEWAVLLAGRIELALHLVGKQFRGTPIPPVSSNAKLVFTVDSDLLEQRSKLERAGVPVGEIKRYRGFPYSLCDGQDPERNVFQLSQLDEI
jgi:catechol 2,3-dioxygenase-like lactoylglutathione lyase family enzyme